LTSDSKLPATKLLSTCGGSTNFGFTLYTFLKSLPVPLCAINAGNIESMGIIMFLAANRRITSPHSRFLIHPMNWYFSQKSVDHQRLREYLSSLDNDLAGYVQIFTLETAEATTKLDIFHCLSGRESHRRTRIPGLSHCTRDEAEGVCR
jgi:ATP-dependent protease ClpP protease subunit